MKLLLEELQPFVRYARKLDSELVEFTDELCAYDHRLMYCIGGSGHITLNGNESPVKAGTVLLWQAGCRYRYTPCPADPMRFWALNFDFSAQGLTRTAPIPPARADEFDQRFITEEVTVADVPLFSHPLVLYDQNRLYPLFSDIVTVFQEHRRFSLSQCRGLLLSLLSTLALAAETPDRAEKDDTVDAVIAWLQEHYAEPISNTALGERFGYHPNHLNHLFLQQTGVTLHRYLQNLRVMQAVRLLQDTSLSVADVATAVGFRDLPHFSRYFKQQTGYFPSAFRV